MLVRWGVLENVVPVVVGFLVNQGIPDFIFRVEDPAINWCSKATILSTIDVRIDQRVQFVFA